MAYCTLQDLVDRIGNKALLEVVDLERSGRYNTDRIDAACADATATINTYIMARYTVPISPVPAGLKTLAVNLALEQLFIARGFSADSSDQAIVKAADNSRRTLELIAKGVVSLGVEQPKRDQAAQIVAPDRVFDRTKMEGF